MMIKQVILYHLKRLFVLFAVTFCMIIPFLTFHYPYAKFYSLFYSNDENLKRASILNNARVNQAVNYFAKLNTKESQQFYQRREDIDLDLVVAIVTVARKNGQHSNELSYLFQTASAMDKILKLDTNFKSKMFFLCNVDQSPQQHTDAEYLKQFIPIIYRYNKSASMIKIPDGSLHSSPSFYNKTVHSSRYEKETIDYMFCLEAANSLNPKYVLLLEDDTIPDKALFDVLHYKLNYHLLHSKLSIQGTAQNFAYFKLYYPQRWQGYAFEMLKVLEVISIGCVGAGLFLICLRVRYKSSRISPPVYFLYFMSGFLYLILFTQLFARQNMLELRRISRYLFTLHTSPGCCTQAMFYPSKIIPTLLKFLERDDILYSLHTDLAIYKFVTSTNIPAYQIEPNLFYHIGMYTSLADTIKYKDPLEFIFDIDV